jgi:polyhydroxyalkanoate synthase
MQLPSRVQAVLDPVHAMLDVVPFLGQANRVRRGMQVLATAPRPPVGLTPNVVVHRQDKLQLRYYAPPEGSPARPPVVIVPSLINRAYICDLEPGRSLVEALAQKGHPTYLIDWGTPGPEDAHEDVGFVVLDLLQRSIDRACRHAGSERAFVLGYCLGGVLSAMFAALRPERVAGLVALNTPARFSEGGRFKDLVGAIDVARAFDADGLVPVSVMKPAFMLLDPMGNWSKHFAIEEAARDPRKLARVLVRERWLEENVPMPGAFAREFVENAYHHDRLLQGTWTVRGERVDLKRITAPVHVVACKKDFIVPIACAAPLADAVGGPSRTTLLDTGHIGVVVGAEGPRTFYPLLDSWFREVSP